MLCSPEEVFSFSNPNPLHAGCTGWGDNSDCQRPWLLHVSCLCEPLTLLVGHHDAGSARMMTFLRAWLHVQKPKGVRQACSAAGESM